jgi:exonuclease SbcC
VGSATQSVATMPRNVDPECRRLVGLDAAQFQRVVLLPQGKFTDFLISTPESRKELLSELFGGGLYEQATEWLKREKIRLDELVRDSDADVKHHRDNAINSLRQALTFWSGPELPDEPSDDDLVAAIEALAPERLHSQVELDAALGRAQRAEAGATTAAAEAQRFDDAAEYRNQLTHCEATRAATDAARQVVEASRRARPVLAARTRLEAAKVQFESATSALRALRTSIDSHFSELGRPCPEFTATEVAAAAAELDQTLLNDEQLLRAAGQADVNAVAAELAAHRVAAELEGHTAVVAAAHDQCVALNLRIDELAPVAAGLDRADQQFRDAEGRLRARGHLEAREGERLIAVEHEVRARMAYAAAWDAFVRSQAPRLAAELRPGAPCQVCGSTEHPAPAVLGSQPAVDYDEVEGAVAARSKAEAAVAALTEQVRALRHELGDAAEVPVATLQEAVDALTSALASATSARGELLTLRDQLVIADAAHRGALDLKGALERDDATAKAVAAERRDEAMRLQREIAHLDPAELERRRGVVTELQGSVQQLGSAFTNEAAARQEHDGATEAFEAALAASGFGSAAEVDLATVDLDRENELDRQVDDWDTRFANATASLEAVERLGVPAERPDVSALRAAADEAAQEQRHVAERHTTASIALDAASDSLEQSTQVAVDSADLRAQRNTAAAVFKTCNGEAGIRVKLESWVLAAELDRVTAAANVHLGRMSNGRYRLARKGGRSALDLEVFDAHTGRERATASLSGGEQFQASLSLALGLADVVSHGGTASGKQFEALFVDEGFGSLDPRALDDAIEALSLIQAGGRMVGAITHVEAMKERLHPGIEVKALPDGRGSTLSVNP